MRHKHVYIPLLMALVLVMLPNVSALSADENVSSIFISITEDGKVIDYLENYYIVNVFGTMTVYNPHDVRVYSIFVPTNFNSLTFVERSDTEYVTQAQNFLINELNPGETAEIEYSILGITPTNPLQDGNTVLHSLIDDDGIEFLSRLEEQLLKADLEDSDNQPSTRLVSVHISNPTGFDYVIDQLDVIKTNDLNPNDVEASWSFPLQGETNVIEPFSLYVQDILDEDASDGEVYWMVTDISIRNTIVIDFTDVILENIADEQGFFIDAPTTVERELEDLVDRSEIDLVARKASSKSVVNPGDIFNVSIVVDNFASFANNVDIVDQVPEGFTIIEAYGGGSIRGDQVVWTGETVSSRNSRHVNYAVQFDDAESVGLIYLDRAKIEAADKTVYTSKVPLVRRYQPNDVIYVQKRLNFQGEDTVDVTITIQNLGEGDVYNLLLKEFLEEEDEFRQLSALPREKGLWEIALLAAGDTWTVSYTTDQHTQLNTLPEIYGVDRATVTKSIMLVNTVEYNFFRKSVKTIEIIGLMVVLLVPLGYFLLNKYGLPSMPKSSGIKRVKAGGAGGGELHIIKEKIPAPEKKDAAPPPKK